MTPPRMSAIADALQAVLTLVAALSFGVLMFLLNNRAPAIPVYVPAIVFLVCALGLNLIPWRFAEGRSWLPVLVLALVVADLARLAGLWPCDVGCQGGGHYQTVAGISIVWPALFAHLALAGLALRDARRGAWSAWTRHAAGLLAGVSVFFLLIAGQLSLSCSYCSVVNLTTLIAWSWVVQSARAAREAHWWQYFTWPLAGWLLANAVFHHTPVTDVSAPPSGTTPTVTQPLAGDAALLTHIDAGRTRGRADAPATLELALDLHCAACAKLHGPLLVALAPAITDGRLKVVIRHVVRRSHQVGRDSARLVLAAAAVGEHDLALITLLDSNPMSRPEGLRARLAEAIAIAPVDTVLRDHLPALDQTIDADATRLAVLKVGIRTPTAVLLRGDQEVGRWSGEFEPGLVIAALGR